MTAINAGFAVHATLTGPGTVDTVTLTACRPGIIRVTNKTAAGSPIYFVVYTRGAVPVPADPTTAPANDTYIVPSPAAGLNGYKDIAWAHNGAIIKLVSAANQAYSIESISGGN